MPEHPAPRPARQPPDSTRLALVVSIVVTVVLYAIPEGWWLIYPLMLLSTLAHEMGHGMAALLVGGRFHRFTMWPDGSGVAQWSDADPSRLETAFVAAGGLVGPAVVAALLLGVARTPRGARRGLFALVGLLTLSLVLVVRGAFAMLFVSLLIVGLALVARAGNDEVPRLVLVFGAVQLALSVFSRGDYLFTPVAETAGGAMPSDVGQMAAALVLPYWFWGALCGLVSIAVLAGGLRSYWARR